VAVGREARHVLAAVFSLQGGGAACLQLQDEGDLRRGGVYLLERDDPDEAGVAPRFDELFADAALKSRQPEVGRRLVALLQQAREAALQTRPRLEPAALEAIGRVAGEAAQLDAEGELPGPYRAEELVLACLLIFVSEEERYPRPRYQGCEVALQRFLDAVGSS
jgi:hypothetical protein